MTDRAVYNMQLTRAIYALMRAAEKADDEQKQEIAAALHILEKLKDDNIQKALTE